MGIVDSLSEPSKTKSSGIVHISGPASSTLIKPHSHTHTINSTTMPRQVSPQLAAKATQPLYNLADLSSVRTWNYEKPTYTYESRFTAREQWTENSTFWSNFSKFPKFTKEGHQSDNNQFFLPHINLSGLAIFGGSIVDILLKNSPSDIDMAFFCDEGDAESQGKALAARVRKFVEDCIGWMSGENERILEKIESGNTHFSKEMLYDLKSSDKLLVTRYRNCYTIKLPCCAAPIQIIHTKSLDTLLNGIDLDCTRICFYDGEIAMAESCKKSIESLAMILDTTNVAKNYLERVIKYFDKGFDIILEDLNVENLPNRLLEFNMTELLDLPYVNFQLNKVEGNKIMGYRISLSKKAQELPDNEGKNKLGYASSNVGGLIHQNIQNLARKDYEKFTYIGEGELYGQAFCEEVTITERMLTNSYETARTKMWSAGELNFTECENYLAFKPMVEIVQQLVTKFVEGRVGKKVIFAETEFDKHVEGELKALIAGQIAVCKELILGLKGTGSLAIQVIDDSVVSIGKKEFYGKYFKE